MLHDDDARATNERRRRRDRPSNVNNVPPPPREIRASSSSLAVVVVVSRRRRALTPTRPSSAPPSSSTRDHAFGVPRHVGRAFAVQDAPTPNLLWFTYSTRVDRHLHRYVYRFLNIRSVYSVYNVCKKGQKGSLRNRDFLSISSQYFLLRYFFIPCLKKYQQRCP